MFDAIKSFVAELAGGEKPAGGFVDQDFRIAYAALLVHAAAVDGSVSAEERDKLQVLLKQRFGLSDGAAGELVEQATAADQDAIDLYHFTHTISGALDDAERLRFVEMMWAVAYADGEISEYEDNLIWRVADLLGVSSAQRIALRQRVAATRRPA